MTQDRLPAVLEARMTGDQLIKQFENGTTPPDTFHHADHVRLAFEYLFRYPALEALEKFSAALDASPPRKENRNSTTRPSPGPTCF